MKTPAVQQSLAPLSGKESSSPAPSRTAERGFTLLEVLVTCAIMGVMLAAIFSLYAFGVKAFESGTKGIDLQQNVRLGADFVTRELRYAEDVELLSSGERVRYEKDADSNSYLLRRRGNELVIFINNVENKIAYDIRTFSMELDEDKNLLRFTITGEDGKEGFVVNSAVYLKNM